MNWSLLDFIVAGVLVAILGVGGAIFFRLNRPVTYRLGFVFMIVGMVLLFWAGGAVGIIGDENNSANLLYLLVMLTGVVGGVYTRFTDDGMMRTLVVMAILQTTIGVAALTLGWGDTAARWPWDVIAATLGFDLVWLLGAGLFRSAKLGSSLA
ncbi:hypothetical protein [Ponticaulis sp.]|uniref:hypothetical protein n=1 Tax=Ponticaulis sp. TaxID=2020902 RepID=UPI000B669CEE|nr:hypothetical protein [Ponticaulis sp.]MAI91900.1 hypothetical protein [Ponticaulis sp.]OUX96580.1 MAG: hypothetical protein CBB65_15830 [Hyphomonadaceae bacterium TMED5]|tara:strand:+ start:19402 stop:19860 length:459 start_codon:yes stop_codon:yes gene_type:complete